MKHLLTSWELIIAALLTAAIIGLALGGCSCGPDPTGSSWSCEVHE